MKLEAAVAGFARQQAADGRSGHTRAAYARDLRTFGDWLGGSPALSVLTPDHLARFLTSDQVLLTPDGRPRAPITVNRTKSALRSFFAFCVESGWIRENPARLIRSSRTTAREPATLTEAEIRRLRQALSDRTETLARRGGQAQRDRLILGLLLGTGIRLGSLVGLNTDDVDLQTGTLHIQTKGGERTGCSSILNWSACWAGSSGITPLKPTQAATLPSSAAGARHGWDRGQFNCGSPSCAARLVSPAMCPSIPSATPSPPACTRRPVTCTWCSAPSATGTSRPRRSMRG